MDPVIAALEKAMAPGTAERAGWMLWAPPAWFLGLYEVIAGTSRPVAHIALLAVLALAFLLPLAFGLYAFTYQRLTRRAIEGREADRLGSRVGRETTAYNAPVARTRWMWPFWLVGYALFSSGLAAVEGALLRHGSGAIALAIGIAVAAFCVRAWRERDFGLAVQILTFSDGEEDAPITLALDGIVPLTAPHA